MTRETLQSWLLSDDHFRTSYEALEVRAVRSQFPNLNPYESQFEMRTDWPYLLFSGSILAPSALPQAEEMALRIAHSALSDATASDAERDAALVILDSLANRRAVRLAEDRKFVQKNVEGRLGYVQSIDWLRRSIENRIDLAGGEYFQANKFQMAFWEAAQRNTWLSVSAPTSAGKSFVLAQFLIDKIKSKKIKRVVYIAPTRALIQQVEIDLRKSLVDAGLEGVELRSLPRRSSQVSENQEILVFTQERLHYYLEMYGTVPIDVLIVDEAHKIGDSSRGILLQDVIERVTFYCPETQVIFTAPLAENPDTLLFDGAHAQPSNSFVSEVSTVNQNLLWASADSENPRLWELSLRRKGRSIPLGTFETENRLSTIKSRIAQMAILSDTGDGGVLVYANGAARAEEIAAEIASLIPSKSTSKEIMMLDELCRTTIHKKFALRNVIKRGVAFHYGNMPLILRSSIESLFKNGHLRYLVCTSTLVEGVNLPCRNIVVRAPKKGSTEPMSAADFWNLAGRAGRWGKEFQGKVICIDTDDEEAWGDTLPTWRRGYSIERSSDRVLKEKDRLLEYINAKAPSYSAEKNTELESEVSYLSAVREQFGSIARAPWRNRFSASTLEEVDEVLGQKLADIQIPVDWIRRHAGISPFAMQRMAAALANLKAPLEKFVPIDPEGQEAARQYGRIFQLMGHHMTTVFGTEGRCIALGILTTNWMMGYPISRIISERRRWNKKKRIEESISSTIRKVFRDVEQIARFQAPRYLACYSDIVRVELRQRGLEEQSGTIPDLTLSLEFGVRGNLQLFLMGLGLSRSSTLAISDDLVKVLPPAMNDRDDLDLEAVVDGLRRLQVSDMALPSLVSTEIEELISRYEAE